MISGRRTGPKQREESKEARNHKPEGSDTKLEITGTREGGTAKKPAKPGEARQGKDKSGPAEGVTHTWRGEGERRPGGSEAWSLKADK